MKQKGLYLETFGCQMNTVDSERIVGLMKEMGYLPVETAEEADLILLNTCTVRDKAERKVYGHLGSFKPLKEKRPDLIIGVGGCVAQQEGDRLLQKLPFVSIVFGTHNVHKLPEMVQAAQQKLRPKAAVDFLEAQDRQQLFPERTDQSGPTRFVTVMQGCDNYCSYCIVPYVRGREVSRPSEDVIDEVRSLVATGVREVTLLGQNVNSYGLKEDNGCSFATLLQRVHAIDGLERIRFTTSHPKDFSDELIDCFGSLDKLCWHLQLPLQSGSDRILAQMKRGYTQADYLQKVKRLKQVCPEIRLTTDVIVGFPGETEEDFAETMKVLAEVGYADIYSFLYSPRSGTQAYTLEDATPPEVKQARFDRMMALQQKIGRAIWQADEGRVVEVLVEGEAKMGNGQMFGRSTWNRIVNFAGPSTLAGQLVKVRIVESTRNSQIGTLIDPA